MDKLEHLESTKPKKVLIVAPHPDDEIFAITRIREVQKSYHSVSVLYLSGTDKRLREASKSCSYLGFQILLPARIFKDGLLHESFEEIKDLVFSAGIDCSHILVPALEGGHQDHDTVALAMLLSIEEFAAEGISVYFYPCYTSWRETFLYKVNAFSSYADSLTKVTTFPPTTAFIPQEVYLAFFIYRSQLKTWLLLYPIMLLRRLIRKDEILYRPRSTDMGNKLSIMKTLNQRPLYEIHGRLKLGAWKQSIIHACYKKRFGQ